VARVFVSHASVDSDLAATVHNSMAADGHDVFLDRRADDGIRIGEDWESSLYSQLRRADAVVSIVTEAYVASRWCFAEVVAGRMQGRLMLPLMVEPGLFHPLLRMVQHVEFDVSDDQGMSQLLRELRRLDAGGGMGWPDGRSPFPGLEPFSKDMRAVFFGRDEEIRELASLLRSTVFQAAQQPLVITGPSGCGKSSLVRAGLVPEMLSQPGWWSLPSFRPGSEPMEALTEALLEAAGAVGLAWHAAGVRARLDEPQGLMDLARDLLRASGPSSRGRLLVVVDQFEETITLADAESRARFAETLRLGHPGPIQVVAALRSESLADVQACPEYAGRSLHVYSLEPIVREVLPRVIESPSQVAGIRVSSELVGRLVTDTETGDALPFLAFVLEQLARGIVRGGELSRQRYDELGGVRGALLHQADAAFAEAIGIVERGEDHRVEYARRDVLDGLLRLVASDDQGHATRRWVELDDVPSLLRAQLDVFVKHRLLTTTVQAGRVEVGVAHEAFLTSWPPIVNAVAAAGMKLRMRQEVERAAADWREQQKSRELLWHRGRIAVAYEALDVTRARRQFLSSRYARMAEQLQRGLRAVRTRGRLGTFPDRLGISPGAWEFLNRSVRWERRRRLRAFVVLSVVIALLATATSVALVQRQAAQQQQREALARQLIAEADTIRVQDPRTALLLGLAADRINPGGETRASLVETLSTTQYAGTITGQSGPVHDVVFSRKGMILATATENHQVLLWDLTQRTHPRLGKPIQTGQGPVNAVAFSPDGHTLAIGSEDHHVTLVDLTHRAHPHRIGMRLDAGEPVYALAFSPDGTVLAAGTYESVPLLWNMSNPARPTAFRPPTGGHAGAIDSLAFAGRGHVLATGGGDRNVILWDYSDLAHVHPIGSPLAGVGGTVRSLAFSSDAHILAGGSLSSTLVLWDLTDPAAPRQASVLHTANPINAVAFDPGKPILATGSDDHTVTLWDVSQPAAPKPAQQPLTSHLAAVQSVAFSPDGKTLATGSSDQTVTLWNLTSANRPVPRGQHLTGRGSSLSSTTFSPDGRILAAAGEDGSVILWGLDNKNPSPHVESLLPGTTPVSSIAFSPTSDTLAVGTADNTVTLWDLAQPLTPHQLGPPLTGPTGPVSSVAISADGHLVAAGSADGTVTLWTFENQARPHWVTPPLTRSRLSPVNTIAFTQDGQELAVGSADGTVAIWNLVNPARPYLLSLPADGSAGAALPVNSVAFSPDGKTLAAGSDGFTVTLWDTASPASPRPLGRPLTGPVSPVNSVAFSPDGQILAASTDDPSVVLWDLTDRNQPRILGQPAVGPTKPITSVAFATNGSTIAAASDDGAVTLWSLNELNELRQDPTSRACQITLNGFSPHQWLQFVSAPYQPSCPTISAPRR
jgi:WD40 repeat protein